MSEQAMIRDRDGDLRPPLTPGTPTCTCDGTGTTEVIVGYVGPRMRPKYVVRVCPACRPDTAAGLPSVASRSRSTRAGQYARRPRLALVYSATRSSVS
jgi:hypothetical protein